MEQSESVIKLAEALVKAQSSMGPVKRQTTNPFFKMKYAELSVVLDAIRKPLSEHGLSLIQAPETKDGEVVLTTMLLHVSGEWIKSSLSVKPKDAQNPQVLGSIITYLRRYTAPGYALIASEDDDDGNAASVEGKKEEEKKEASKKEETGKTSKATPGQIKFIQTLFGKAGYKEDLDKHAYLTGVVNREINSSSELSSKEAHAVIEALQKLTGSTPAL